MNIFKSIVGGALRASSYAPLLVAAVGYVTTMSTAINAGRQLGMHFMNAASANPTIGTAIVGLGAAAVTGAALWSSQRLHRAGSDFNQSAENPLDVARTPSGRMEQFAKFLRDYSFGLPYFFYNGMSHERPANPDAFGEGLRLVRDYSPWGLGHKGFQALNR